MRIQPRSFGSISLVLGLAGACSFHDLNAAGVFPVATNLGAEFAIGAAFDGTNYLVGIEGDEIAHYNITAQLVSPTGALIGSRIKVGRTGGVPFIAFGATNYLMVWQDDLTSPNDILTGQRVDRNGGLVGSSFPIASLTAGQDIWGLASGAGSFLVLYSSGGTSGNYPLYSQLISPLGSVSGATYVGTTGPNSAVNSVAFGGTNYLAVWDTGSAIRGRFISSAGVPAPADFLIHTTQQTPPNDGPMSVGFDGVHSRFLVAWHDRVGDGGTSLDLFGQLVAANGSLVGAEISISVAPGHQAVPSIAFDGENYLVSWTDLFFSTNANFRFRFFGADGQPLGSEFSLATPPGATVPFLAPVYYGGNQFLTVATYDFSDDGVSGNVYGAFIPKSTAPPRLDVAGPPVGAQFPLRLTGTPGITYTIQASTNLGLGNWTTLVTNSSTNGTFNFTDPQATNASRFYRAVKQ